MNVTNRLKNFIETLSDERFGRYVRIAGSDPDKAVEMYTANARLAQAFYIPLQGLEVTLRNSIHDVMKKDLTGYWFDRPNLIRLGNQLESIVDAKKRIFEEKRGDDFPLNEGRVVAGLSFGFWTSLFDSQYEDIWRTHLHKIVVGKNKGITRKTFSGRLHLIRKIRNRIAHHECIIEGDIEKIYNDILELTGYLSPEARYWIEKNNGFISVYNEYKLLMKRDDYGTE